MLLVHRQEIVHRGDVDTRMLGREECYFMEQVDG